ncbi:hypothetical protein K8I61_15875 [bacterium]|nr:hypothetical protein [bacterium]
MAWGLLGWGLGTASFRSTAAGAAPISRLIEFWSRHKGPERDEILLYFARRMTNAGDPLYRSMLPEISAALFQTGGADAAISELGKVPENERSSAIFEQAVTAVAERALDADEPGIAQAALDLAPDSARASARLASLPALIDIAHVQNRIDAAAQEVGSAFKSGAGAGEAVENFRARVHELAARPAGARASFARRWPNRAGAWIRFVAAWEAPSPGIVSQFLPEIIEHSESTDGGAAAVEWLPSAVPVVAESAERTAAFRSALQAIGDTPAIRCIVDYLDAAALFRQTGDAARARSKLDENVMGRTACESVEGHARYLIEQAATVPPAAPDAQPPQ